MVSWWKAEGNVNDAKGDNNGTLYNGATYDAGKVGQSFSFDGDNDYGFVPNTLNIDGGAEATYMAWVYPKATPGVDAYFGLLGAGDSTSSVWTTQQCRVLYWKTADSPSGMARFYIDCGTNDTESYKGRMSANDYPINQWYSVAGVFNNGALDIYVNGLLDNGTETGISPGTVINTNANNYVWMGAATRFDQSYTGVPFNGLIDEASIYNRALTANEISAIYNAGEAGICFPGTISGLRLWLKADSGVTTGSGDNVTTWEDRSGNGLDVTQATEANQPTRVPAAPNGAPIVRFDGTNGYLQRTSVLGSDLFDNNTDTVFIVQKQAGGDARSSTFSWASDSYNRFMVHATYEDVIYYQVSSNGGGGDQISAPQPPGWDDQWHVLKLIRDGGNGQINVDGIGLSPPTATFSSPGNNSSTADLFIGRDGFTNWFEGDIAEILVFNRALTAQEQQTVENYLSGKYGLTNTPNVFSIPDKVDQPISSLIESDSITVSGINLLAPITISDGGEYSLNNSGIYISTSGIVINGDSVTVRQSSSSSFSATTDVVLTVGGVSDTFSVTTLAGDTLPDAFTFTDQTGVGLSMVVESNTINVGGINTGASISITGGEYKIGAGTYTSAEGAVNDGDTVTVRQTSSGSFSTTTDAVLTIGGVSDTFSVTTLAADTTPSAFTFTDQTGVALSTVVESNSITVAGINTAAPISITGGEYAVNGGAYITSSGTVNNGDTVRVRQTSSGSFSTTTEAVLTLGGVSDGFRVTTLGPINLFLPLIIKK
jgi:hypothetical protein